MESYSIILTKARLGASDSLIIKGVNSQEYLYRMKNTPYFTKNVDSWTRYRNSYPTILQVKAVASEIYLGTKGSEYIVRENSSQELFDELLKFVNYSEGFMVDMQFASYSNVQVNKLLVVRSSKVAGMMEVSLEMMQINGSNKQGGSGLSDEWERMASGFINLGKQAGFVDL